MGVTIFEVADHAGVSKATVSRAFTNPNAVNPETLQRILKSAEKLNYRPNAIARAMITKRTGNFAFLIYGEQAPVITNPFYGPILESVVKVAGDHGYSMFISSDEELRSNSGELILQKQVDGIIFSSQPNLEMVKSAKRSGIPMVFINHLVEDSYCLLCDDQGGIKNAVAHLASLGHENIGMLGGLFTDFVRQRRLSAYADALKANGLPYRQGWIQEVRPSIGQAYAGMMRLLDAKEPVSAVVCMNDTLAIGAIKAAVHRGFSVPGQLSVTGFDNSAYCTICEPELTSVDTNKEALGALAVQCLMAQINGQGWPERTKTLNAELVVRSSTQSIS